MDEAKPSLLVTVTMIFLFIFGLYIIIKSTIQDFSCKHKWMQLYVSSREDGIKYKGLFCTKCEKSLLCLPSAYSTKLKAIEIEKHINEIWDKIKFN